MKRNSISSSIGKLRELLQGTKKSRHRSRRRRRLIERLELRAMLTGVTLIDINQSGAGSEPQLLTVVDDQVFFLAHDGINGLELWKTDSTEAGTVLVKDIIPGPEGAFDGFNSNLLANVNGTLFFGVDDGVHGFELWKSDGTEPGTVLVKDIFPGNSSSNLSSFTAHKDHLYFSADDGVNGLELWKSDGTEAGTRMVRNINPIGSTGGQSVVRGTIVSFGDVVLFGANDGVNGLELWRTDGTVGGTSLLSDVRPGELSPGNPAGGFFGSLTVSGSFAYFTGNNGVSGIELFRTDGTTAGTQFLGDINPGSSNSSFPFSLTDVNGTLFFGAQGPGGRELYKSDGTPAGTVRVKDINPVGNGLSLGPVFTAVGNRLFFQADNGATGGELWVTDGTEAGTRLVKDINPGTDFSGDPNPSFIRFIVDVNGTAFFSANDGVTGQELWTSDGTTAGTRVVRDINPQLLSSGFGEKGVAFGNQLLFPAEDGDGFELWKSNGSQSGTVMIKDIDTLSTSDSFPYLYNGSTSVLNGEIFFRAATGKSNTELVKSDGTRSGTSTVKDIDGSSFSSFPSSITRVKDHIFFAASETESGTELWKTDGTEAGTELVKDIVSGVNSSSPGSFAALNDKLIFSAEDSGVAGRELWISDGTSSGTKLLKDIRPGSGDSGIFASYLGRGLFNGELFFSANNGTLGAELWKTNGTTEGTVLVKDIRSGSGSSLPRNFVVFGDSLFFTASGAEGRELWKTDGTATGTVLVKDINPGPADSLGFTGALSVHAGTLYLAADNGANGTELWKSNGTAQGTVLVKDINPGSGSSNPQIAGSIGNTVLFSANTTENGRELWKTNGTAAGTVLVKDILPGPAGSNYLFGSQVFEGVLYFGATDGTSGNELWRSDGTAAGTTLVEDIFPGDNGSFPRGFQQVNGRLLFSAGGEGGVTIPAGRELFRLGATPTSLTASMVDAHAIDVDNDGNVEPGDTLRYTVTLAVGIDADADGVIYTQALDPNTSIVPGSVSTSQGTITVGSNGGKQLNIGFGTIRAGGTVTVTYSVRIDDPLPLGVTQIANQATIGGSNFDDVLTDDPALSGAANPTTTVINRNSSAATLAIAATSADKAEGNSGSTPFTFIVTRSGNVSAATTVSFAVTGNGGTPAQATDFVGGAFPTGQVSFAANEASKVITVNVVGETMREADEGFIVTLSNASGGATIATASALGVIRNDDTVLAIAATSADKAEGNSGSTPFTFTVTRSGNVTGTTTANFAVVPSTSVVSTAAQPADFTGGVFPTGLVSFAANETSKVITINVLGDAVIEPDEGFTLLLSNASGGATFVQQGAPGVIRNDDAAATLAIAATSANKVEGNSGSTPFTFTVTRFGNVSAATTVNFAVTGSSATPAQASDFTGGVFPNGQVAFAANETSKVITINVLGDAAVEANEGFTVTLSGASGGAIISTATATGVIRNDDAATTLAIVATIANKAEGNSGSTPFTFTVTRSGSVSAATTVNFAVTGSGTTPAQANDFTGGVFPSGQVAFAANETSKVITINVLGNTIAEANEGFTVTLSGASGGATITTAAANGLIRNDDTALAIAATSANKPEGNSGSTPFTFTVTRSGNVSGATTVNYAVTGSGATPAQANDFVGGVFPSGQVSFAANETSKVITINVLGDAVIEANEGFTVTLSAPSTGATILTATALGVIQNDENSISIAATSANKNEGNSGTTPFTFTVTRIGNISTPSTVNFAVTGSGTTPAQASDFVGSVFPTGQVAFAANETSKVITIPVRGDTTVEANEGFTVTLSNATAGFSITTGTAAGLIRTDDTSLAIAATSANKAEGNSGSTAYTFTVTRTGLLTQATTVNYVVAGSGATPATASDFVGNVLPSGVVTFAIGETSKLITINVVGDRVVEGNEGFVVNLSGATAGATIATATAVGLIRNDDTSVSIAATNADQFEPVAGSTPFTFTVTRTGLTTGTSSVNFAVVGSGSNPASASDFVGGQFPSGTVVFAPGETSKVITIQVASDNVAEVNEGFTVNLSSPSVGVTLGSPNASGVIREGCLSGGPLVAGDNVLTYTCGVPGTIVGFALGSNSGSTTIAEHGVTLDIAGASVIGLGVVDATGRARIVVRLTAAQAAARLYFQAFEISPAGKKSNVFVD